MTVNTPTRIQRQRTKGWRMPHGTIYVGRPTRWGNPYQVGDDVWPGVTVQDRAHAADYYGAQIMVMSILTPDEHSLLVKTVRRELGGHDLACWCPLDQPCHADVLLELANGGAS